MAALKSLQHVLQEACHKKRSTRLWDSSYVVSGPLTWKDFHKMAWRGSEDGCKPQPIPSILVGYDKDWVSYSPFVLKYWVSAKCVRYVLGGLRLSYCPGRLKTYLSKLCVFFVKFLIAFLRLTVMHLRCLYLGEFTSSSLRTDSQHGLCSYCAGLQQCRRERRQH